MSTNTNDPYKANGQNTWQGSTNQGTHEAQQGYQATPQQAGESAISYQTRMAAYNANKS